MQANDTRYGVVEINTDPVFSTELAKCEVCDWRPSDPTRPSSVLCEEHTAETGHMTAIPILEYVYYATEDEVQAINDVGFDSSYDESTDA